MSMTNYAIALRGAEVIKQLLGEAPVQNMTYDKPYNNMRVYDCRYPPSINRSYANPKHYLPATLNDHFTVVAEMLSYQTTIATIVRNLYTDTYEIWYDEHHYSPSTSRQMSNYRSAISGTLSRMKTLGALSEDSPHFKTYSWDTEGVFSVAHSSRHVKASPFPAMSAVSMAVARTTLKYAVKPRMQMRSLLRQVEEARHALEQDIYLMTDRIDPQLQQHDALDDLRLELHHMNVLKSLACSAERTDAIAFAQGILTLDLY